MKIKVLIVDDHKIMREGLKSLLDKETDLEMVGEADNGRTAIQYARDLAPQVVLMDLSMPEMNGIDATRRIVTECPSTKVLALSMHSDRRFVEGALAAGAHGFLLKDCAFDELVVAIREVAGGRFYLSPRIAGLVVKDFLGRGERPGQMAAVHLTPREREVLQLIAEGKNTKEIAFALNVSVKTVETQRMQVMRKLQTNSIAELTKYAIREGLTTMD
ncbi:DNA-binding response regulator [Geotalea uraniireducens]|uniref:DNA-binding response regulator n=1 Tax=Geotalea uraniireducens TaxID=351604 RepID=A0ABM8EIZ3_9BACT|nr:response regulator transcription factor [Geotalea uraniireducens]BDV42455.1 DNA-binding response regulator [Geotalea uraniireducens]